MRFRNTLVALSTSKLISLSRLGLCVVAILSSGAWVRAQVSFAGTQFSVAGGEFQAPSSVATDGKGNVYIADRGNNRIVEVMPSGTGFTAPVVLLSGLSSPGGVAADWSGDLFISDTGNGRILKLAAGTSGPGAAITVAENLNNPAGLALDSSGNLYVANSGNNAIVEIAAAGSGYQAPVVIGSGFSNPMGVTVDAARNLYVADTGNNRIVEEVFSSAGYVTQQTMWTSISAPMGLGIDKTGNLFIAANGGSEVLEKTWFAGAKRFNTTLTIGTGVAAPAGVAINESGQVFIADAGSNQVLSVLTTSLEFGTIAVGAPASALTYNFSIAAGTTLSGVSIVTQGVSGKDFSDGGSTTCAPQTYTAAVICGVSVGFSPLAPGVRTGAVVLSGASGGTLSTAFISGVGAMPKLGFIPAMTVQLGSQLSGPGGVAVDGAGNLYISDSGNNRVVELPWTGSGYGPETVVPINGLINPMGLAFDGAGNLYVVSNGNDKVIELPWTPSGFGLQTKVGSGLYGPSNVAVGANGAVFISDTLDQRVDDIVWTGSGFAQESNVGNHKAPIGVAVDAAANLYFTDPYQNVVSKLQWIAGRYIDQEIITIRGTSFPGAVAVDANQDLFILDSVTNQLIMLPWNGSSYGDQMTVAGGFNAPSAVTIDSNGILYVADTGNNQIVKIDLSIPGGMTYANTYLGSTSVDSPQVTMIGNVGSLPVAFSGLSYPLDFPEGTAAAAGCTGSTTLTSSEWCELAVDFTPTVTGSILSEAVTLNDNSSGIAGAQQSISVSGASLSKASQAITFQPPTGAAYGATPIALSATASSGLPVTFSVIGGPGVLSSNGKLLSFSGVGTVTLQAIQSGNGSYSAAPPVTLSVTVAPATLTVSPRNVMATYGAIPATFTYTVTGFVNRENSSVLTGQAAIAGPSSPSVSAGSYTLQASAGSLQAANYVFAFGTGVLTVNPAILQVRALSQTVVYGKSPSTLQWELTGFVNGDNAGAVHGAPMLTTNVNSRTGVGVYLIAASAGSLAAANYTFSFYPGSLVVAPALLTVTAASQTITYGSSLPAATYTISGFVNGDTAATAVKGTAALAAQFAGKMSVGKYPVSCTQGTLSAANYRFSFVPGAIAVEKAQLQITAGNAVMTYGQNLPVLSYTVAGFVNGETANSAMSGAPSLSSTASVHPLPGSFAIRAANGTLAATNYSFSFISGVLTVNKAALTVSPKTTSMTYGAHIPASVLDYSGFVNGDGVSSLTGAPSIATQATSSASVGTYPVVLTMGSLASQKYNIALQQGTLTVTPAILTVAAQGGSMTYGGKMPSLAYEYKGFVNGDTANLIKGTPALQCGASATAAVGSYPITVTVGSLNAANYTFQFAANTMTVNKAVLTVTPVTVSMTYGAAMPGFTYSLGGLVNGDLASKAVSGAPQIGVEATSTSGVGTYGLSAELGTLSARNYSFVFKTGAMTVNKAQLTVTAINCSMTAGASVPSLTYTIKGFVGGDTQANATSGKPSVTTSATASSKAGSYSVVAAQGNLNAKNYSFIFVNGTLTVN